MRWRTLRSRTNRIDTMRTQAAHHRLGVAESASEAEIKAAYRRQVRLYHPDRVDPFLKRHGEAMVSLLNEARDVMLARLAR